MSALDVEQWDRGDSVVCPDWCERTDHDADYVGPGCPPMHYGPGFGPFFPQGDGDEPSEIVTCDSDVSYPVQGAPEALRRLAADALAAAAWIEANR